MRAGSINRRDWQWRWGCLFVLAALWLTFVHVPLARSADPMAGMSGGGEGTAATPPAPQAGPAPGAAPGGTPPQWWGAPGPTVGGPGMGNTGGMGGGMMGCGGMGNMGGMMGGMGNMGGTGGMMGPMGGMGAQAPQGAMVMNEDRPLTMREILYILSMQDALRAMQDLLQVQRKALQEAGSKDRSALLKEIKGIEERLDKITSDYRTMLTSRVRNE